MKLALNFILITVLACSSTTRNNQTEPNLIYDYENILSEEQKATLNSLVQNHEKRTTNEIAIVTTPNFGSDSTMFDYSYRWANTNGVGKKDKNNGVAIVVSAQKRSVFIQNGRGTEKVISDWETKQIVDSVMIPHFKSNNYYEGIRKGAQAIIKHLEKPENVIK